jgi:hypothetical protein
VDRELSREGEAGRVDGQEEAGVKRSFTDVEAHILLTGITEQPLADLCLAAALTGMRPG